MGPDSELTAKAREVLAGLSDYQRITVLRLSMRDDAAAWCFVRYPTAVVLHDLGVVRDGAGQQCSLTDLGREVARLLSEVARG